MYRAPAMHGRSCYPVQNIAQTQHYPSCKGRLIRARIFLMLCKAAGRQWVHSFTTQCTIRKIRLHVDLPLEGVVRSLSRRNKRNLSGPHFSAAGNLRAAAHRAVARAGATYVAVNLNHHALSDGYVRSRLRRCNIKIVIRHGHGRRCPQRVAFLCGISDAAKSILALKCGSCNAKKLAAVASRSRHAVFQLAR